MKTVFEKIINKEIKAKIIYEDEIMIAIYDIKPITKGHFLVIPKQKCTNLFDVDENTLTQLIIKTRILAIQEIKKIGKKAFKLQINNGIAAGQEIPYLHIHIIPY